MKFTLSWLKRHLDTDATIEQVAEAMTLAGLEVEEIENPDDLYRDIVDLAVILLFCQRVCPVGQIAYPSQ